jgi:hypothetical protein
MIEECVSERTGDRDAPPSRLRLGSDELTRRRVVGLLDVDRAGAEVYVAPAKAEQLAAT